MLAGRLQGIDLVSNVISVWVAVALVLWVTLAVRWMAGRAPIPFQSRRAVPWGMIDLAIALVMWLVLQVPLIPLLEIGLGTSLDVTLDEMSADQQILVLTASAVASLLALGLALGLIRWRTRAQQRDFGWELCRLHQDSVWGLSAL